MTSAPEGLHAALAALGAAPSAPVTVNALSAGASRHTSEVMVGDRRLILQQRRADGEEARVPIAVEVALLREATAAGLPVAPVLLASVDGADGTDQLGEFVLLEALRGEALPRRLLRDPVVRGDGEALAHRFGELLAAIHRLPLAALEAGGATPLPSGPASARMVLDGLPTAHPVIEYGLRRLELEPPPPRNTVVCHGDFRLGNLLIDTAVPDGAAGPPAGTAEVTGILDWELCHPGDPRSDLAWLCAPTWRFGGPQPVAGLGSVESLLRGYAAGGGDVIEAEELGWFLAAASVRWAVICLMQCDAHLTGSSPSLELAVIGRRTAAAEADLLAALGAPVGAP